MKRMMIIAALLLSFICASAQNGKSIYQKYSDSEGVSAVYISPAMFRLMGKIPDMEVEGKDVNLAPIIQTLTGLYIINSEDPEIIGNLKKDVDKFISGGKYELLMEAKDSGDIVRMYTVGTETIVDSFVMIAVEPDETSFICIDGKIKREDLEKALGAKMKD
ncbi:MAG: DUF4252 domain-containing protein [Bacteroidales bacterium]|nr:DUF4252 domain-containing protein [Bacteroidales bacterium]